MIVSFEFMKAGSVVYRERGDLGIIPEPITPDNTAFLLAASGLEYAIETGDIAAEAGEWDTVKIAGKEYPRPANLRTVKF